MNAFRNELNNILYKDSYCNTLQEMLEIDAKKLEGSGIQKKDIMFELYKKYATGYAKYQRSKPEVSTWSIRDLAEFLYETDEYTVTDGVRDIKVSFLKNPSHTLNVERVYGGNMYSPGHRIIFFMIGYIIFFILIVCLGFALSETAGIVLFFLSGIIYTPTAVGCYFLTKHIAKKNSRKKYDVVIREIESRPCLLEEFQNIKQECENETLPPKDNVKLCEKLKIPRYDVLFGIRPLILKKAYRDYSYFYSSIEGGIALSVYAKYAIKEKLPVFSIRPFYRGKDIVCVYDFAISKILIQYPWIEFPSYILTYLSEAHVQNEMNLELMRAAALRISFKKNFSGRKLPYKAINEIRHVYLESEDSKNSYIVSEIRYTTGDSLHVPHGIITLESVSAEYTETLIISDEAYSQSPFDLGDILCDVEIAADPSLKFHPLNCPSYIGILSKYSVKKY